MKRLAFSLCLISPLLGCTEATPPAGTPVGLANPASVYCVEQGGKVVPSSTLGGDSRCELPDGRKVGEWEYYNEHHRADPAPAEPAPDAT